MHSHTFYTARFYSILSNVFLRISRVRFNSLLLLAAQVSEQIKLKKKRSKKLQKKRKCLQEASSKLIPGWLYAEAQICLFPEIELFSVDLFWKECKI